jgi:hypothetical protein
MRKRLSYANVTATLALVFAMSGGAMAANHYLITSTSQISPKVLKKLTGKPGKAGAKGAAGSTGSAGVTGPQGPGGKEGPVGKEGPAGTPATKLFAQVEPDGTINASSPGVQASKYESYTGLYVINFGQEITHCAVVATQGQLPDFSSPGSGSGRNVGSAIADMLSSGYTYPNGYPSADTVEVETYSGSTAADSPFYVAVLC